RGFPPDPANRPWGGLDLHPVATISAAAAPLSDHDARPPGIVTQLRNDEMRMNRVMLALAPIVLGACSDDSTGTSTADGGGTPTAGPTTVTGTTGTSTTSPTTGTTGAPRAAAAGATGQGATTGAAGTSTSGGRSTTGGTVTVTGTTGTSTTDGAGGASTTGTSTTDGGTTGPMTCPYTPPEL